MSKIIILGASGMVGNIVLQEALATPKITEVLSFGRKPLNINDDKYTEFILKDFLDYSNYTPLLKNVTNVFFCIGVYTGSVPDAKFKEITVDYVEAVAKAVKAESPKVKFSLLSGMGADLTEKSRTPFARYKGMSENILLKMEFDQLSIFRPGYIYPVKKRKEPNLMYSISRFLYPVLKLFGESASITSEALGKAMFKSSQARPKKEILENKDILEFLKS